MTKNDEALMRFTKLVHVASNSNPNSPGALPWSRADYDELRMLTNFLGDQLPSQVGNLLKSDFSTTTRGQISLAERIARAIHFDDTFGIPPEPNSDAALLPTFTLEKKDKERVLKLCADMRKIVFGSADFDEPHKKRLLNRIAAIEKQVYSPKGLFDVVLGGVSDIGETLGKFGKDVEPLTKRMQEVAQITRNGTKEYDQIPAPEEIKRLPAPEDESEEE